MDEYPTVQYKTQNILSIHYHLLQIWLILSDLSKYPLPGTIYKRLNNGFRFLICPEGQTKERGKFITSRRAVTVDDRHGIEHLFHLFLQNRVCVMHVLKQLCNIDQLSQCIFDRAQNKDHW